MQGLITHRVAVGDSLQKIARIYDIGDFREIARLNNLKSPYIDAVLNSKDYINDDSVAKVGDVLIIPTQKISSDVTRDDKKEIEAIAYGIDLDIYQDEPVFTYEKGHTEREGYDIKIVAGIKNLSQQLKIRLSTKRGSILAHKNFGSNLYLYDGLLESQETNNKIIFEVESVIRSDFRVKDVRNIKIKTVGGKRVVTCEVIPIEPGQPFLFNHYIEGGQVV